MRNKKNSGSYYTPIYLSKFMLQRVSQHFAGKSELKLLEPSVGDGNFIASFIETPFPDSIKNFHFTAIEKDKNEIQKARDRSKNAGENKRFKFIKDDFLKFQSQNKQRWSVICGNPPYIAKKRLAKWQIEACRNIHQEAELSNHSIKNIWTSFLIKCSKWLEDDGILAFVLPAEILQVKFAEEIRDYLRSHFDRLEIFAFNELLFEDSKGQDTVLLFAYKQSEQKGTYQTRISAKEDLLLNNFTFHKEDLSIKVNGKWNCLSSDELELLHNVRKGYKAVIDYCNSKPGIVTAANKFFIVNRKTEDDFELSKFLKPIIQKGLFVNGSVIFDKTDYKELTESDKPSRLLRIKGFSKRELPNSVVRYLRKGEKAEIDDRYKCRIRERWWEIPNISTPPDGFFFKRSHLYPKLLKNEAKVLVTDSAYKIEMKEGFEINHLIFSFYNSLTLAFAEVEGRSYGGGVLELTPSEFKSLPVPYIPINQHDFKSFVDFFVSKSSIDDVCQRNDNTLLKGIDKDTLQKLSAIRLKLIEKRIQKKAVSIESQGLRPQQIS